MKAAIENARQKGRLEIGVALALFCVSITFLLLLGYFQASGSKPRGLVSFLPFAAALIGWGVGVHYDFSKISSMALKLTSKAHQRLGVICLVISIAGLTVGLAAKLDGLVILGAISALASMIVIVFGELLAEAFLKLKNWINNGT